MFICVAQPGSRKSGVFRLVTLPIVTHEREVQPAERRALAELGITGTDTDEGAYQCRSCREQILGGGDHPRR
jgi:hypothetical protein